MAKNAAAKTWTGLVDVNGKRYSNNSGPPSGGATPLFDANFAAGDTLAKTNGSWAFGASNANVNSSVSVVSNRLRFVFNVVTSDAWAEQRYTSDTTKYSELWASVLFDVPVDFVPSVGNSKGFITMWANTADDVGHYNDGYEDPNGILVGTELWDNSSGGWRPSIRVVGSGYDINALSGGYYFPEGSSAAVVPASAAGKTIEIVQMMKLGTVTGTTGNQNEDMFDTTPGLNGQVGLWSRIPAETSSWTEHFHKTNISLKPHSSVTGVNRGYHWGWVNGGFGQELILNTRRLRFWTSDPRSSL